MASAPPEPALTARYHGAAISLHWLIAALLVYQLALGLRLDQATGLTKFTAFQMHKSIGITVLLLSIARLALRLSMPRPAEFGTGAQLLAARWVHRAFYAVMLLAPLSGWIIISTSKIKVPTMLFGVVPWPHLPLPSAFNEPAKLAHIVLVWSLPALIALHVGAVLYHMAKRDEVPQRMLRPSRSPLVAIPVNIVTLAALAGLGLLGPIPDFWSKAAAPAAAAEPSDEPPAPATSGADASSAAPDPTETAAGAAVAQSCDWTVEPSSRLSFTAHYGSDAVNGTFHKWQARIKFCADDLPHAAINASINLASADTGDSSRDESLRGASFFDTSQFAQAHYSASGFKLTGPGRYAAGGTLSLHGVNRPVRVVFTLVQSGAKATAQGSASLSRLAFGVGSDEWAATDQIPDAVAVQFTIRARRAK